MNEEQKAANENLKNAVEMLRTMNSAYWVRSVTFWCLSATYWGMTERNTDQARAVAKAAHYLSELDISQQAEMFDRSQAEATIQRIPSTEEINRGF